MSLTADEIAAHEAHHRMLRDRQPATDGALTAAALLDVCADCDHYQDNVNTDEPLDPPCRLAAQWNVCTWKEMAGQVASGRTRHPDPCCPWNQVVR